MKASKKIILGAVSVLGLFSGMASAGTWMVHNAKIDSVLVGHPGLEHMQLNISGGTGPCVGKQINFTKEGTVTSPMLERYQDVALQALSEGDFVTIYSHDVSQGCSNATQIIVSKCQLNTETHQCI